MLTIELINVRPPLEEESLANQFEPRCHLDARIDKHGTKLLSRDISRITHFVGVDFQIYIGLDKKDIVDYKTEENLHVSNGYLRYSTNYLTYSRVHPTVHHLVQDSECVSRIQNRQEELARA
jgi:hypothetical protein